ncbi:hypothetical protein [Undibacterium oligocarboniphilum]|uniref:Transposase n=1 Tax=Undibacterium oligocarboniphilum TaxID=666702 RepID=A0A850QQ79_9BURK|nr:hypothetical protein [Undibacterium oligocarboniphilum]MBC3871923.1 hypothetical protein [Undibacterium oligocarboniphilum]NVO79493.1 hypothetical protein [Undibacterium oligocarboniphilum]
MKQFDDKFALELLDAPRRGRPRKHNAKSPALRAREYRLRQKAKKQGDLS